MLHAFGGSFWSVWVHFGRQNGTQIDMGSFWGSHGSPRRPPERPGVPFGLIWGSFWGQFWATFGTKMTPESMSNKLCFVGTDFARFWLLFGSIFGRIVVHFRCPEASAVEKGEHVIFVNSCTFSHNFQGPQRTEHCNFRENLTTWSMPFFGQCFG